MGRHKESTGYWTQPYISLRQASTRTAAFDLAAVAALLPTFYPSFTVHIKVTFRLCSEKNPWILILKTNPTPLSAAGTGALEKTMRDYHCGIICTSDFWQHGQVILIWALTTPKIILKNSFWNVWEHPSDFSIDFENFLWVLWALGEHSTLMILFHNGLDALYMYHLFINCGVGVGPSQTLEWCILSLQGSRYIQLARYVPLATI